VNTTEMKQIASAATDGPWSWTKGIFNWGPQFTLIGTYKGCSDYVIDLTQHDAEKNMKHIETFNPLRVAAMVAVIEAAEQACAFNTVFITAHTQDLETLSSKIKDLEAVK